MKILNGRVVAATLAIAFMAMLPSRGLAAQGAVVAPPPAVRVGGDIKPPAKVKDSKPIYPPDARRANVQGVVIVEATIGTDGKVSSTKVVRPIPLLNDAAVQAVKQREYKPTLIKGVATPVILTVPVIFTLD